jgi:hypothetical protein
MRRFLVLSLALVGCTAAPPPPEDVFAESRFVDDVSGDDGADGTTPETAWRTLTKVNAFIPRTSTRILFKRGGVWRGPLTPHGGSATRGWVSYGAWGAATAPKPLFLGSDDLSEGWLDLNLDGIWERTWDDDASLPSGDVVQGPGNLYFLDADGGVARWGFRKQTRAQLAQEGDFFFSPTERRLELVARAQPGGRLEASRNRTWAEFSGQSFLIFEDLELRFGGGYAFRGHEATHLRFRRLDVSWTGGGTKTGQYVRLGNGVEFEGNVSDAVVEDSRFFQLYDTGVDCQATGPAVFVQKDIVFRRNIISRTGLGSFEFWGRGGAGSRFEDVRFENNTCLYAGGGWGFEQHDHVGQGQLGADVVVFENSAAVSGLVIRDNVFFTPRVGFFAEYQQRQAATRALVDGATLDFNLYAHPEKFVAVLYLGDDPLLLPLSQKFTSVEGFRATGKEAHGLEDDPGFVSLGSGDPFHDDLRPRAGSVALTASSDGGVVGALGP